MDLDKITDIEVLRNLCKKNMVCLKKTVKTPTHIYKKGEWYFSIQDKDGVFLYFDDISCGLQLNYNEADEFLYKTLF